jgi:mannose-6-phosphate isomerase-like protein (cupin superfamily)
VNQSDLNIHVGENMKPYVGNIEKETLDNTFFRKVLYTGKYAQLVVMCVQPGDELGNEVHPAVDQFFRIEKGEAKFVFDNGKESHISKDGDAVIIPAGTYHNVINNSKKDVLKVYTIYSPPNHPEGRLQKTKAEADAAEKAEDEEKEKKAKEAKPVDKAKKTTKAK